MPLANNATTQALASLSGRKPRHYRLHSWCGACRLHMCWPYARVYAVYQRGVIGDLASVTPPPLADFGIYFYKGDTTAMCCSTQGYSATHCLCMTTGRTLVLRYLLNLLFTRRGQGSHGTAGTTRCMDPRPSTPNTQVLSTEIGGRACIMEVWEL